MKKLIIACTLVLSTIAGTVSAQKYAGQLNVTAGASFSMTGLLFTTLNNSIGNNTTVNTTSLPGLNGMLDYGISDRFSVGAAYYYQSWSGDWSEVDSNGVNQNFDYSIKRQNVGLRALFHFGDNENLDTYAGARFGYSFWSTKTNSTGNLDFGRFTSRLWPQAIFGMRYFFSDFIGVNAEFAVGPPYYMMFGLNARFGGN
jgi:hypothetical protein